MTRYPKAGKGRKWTIRELEAVPPDWKGDSLSDGDGLTGEVRVASDGSVSIRFKSAFKWQGKVAWHQCGTWPSIPLETIRRSRDKARELVKTGIDPRDQKKAERIEAQAKIKAVIAESEKQKIEKLTLRHMYEAWLESGVNRQDGNAEIERSFEKDVIPTLGPLFISELSEGHLKKVLRTVIDRGAPRMSICLSNDLVQMFAWAEKRQPWRGLMIEGNPASLIEIDKLLPSDYDMDGERERILSPEEIRELRQIFTEMEANYKNAPNKRSTVRPFQRESQHALWISLGTACRIGELLMAEWSHLNFERKEWFIPKQNVKGRIGKKQDHLVFLSDFVLEHFRGLHKSSGRSRWCFPASNKSDTHVCVKSVSKQVGDRQSDFKDRSKPLARRRNDNSLVLAKGVNGEWTPHDMRRTAATMMQALHVPLDIIDRCQNHVMKGSRVRRHYLHYDYASEKHDAWSKLGARLADILGTQSKANDGGPK